MKICMILEGSYPYIKGGVSNWAHDYIKSMPQHEFVLWVIAANEKDKSNFKYELPSNVTEVRELFLDTALNKKHKKTWRDKKNTLTYAEREELKNLFRCETPNWDILFNLLNVKKFDPIAYFVSEDFLNMLKELSAEQYPFVGFTEYFWNLRSMFVPLMHLLMQDIVEADLYHSVSTGYAGMLGSMAAFISNKPYVLTEHGIYTREREEEILRADWVVPYFKDAWISMFYMMSKCAYHYSHRVTSLFERARDVQCEIGCDREKTDVISNGVKMEGFLDIPFKEREDIVNMGAVLRVAPIKDIKTMLFAFADLQQSYKNARLYIMGPVEDEEYYEECLSLKEGLHIDNVYFTGSINVKEYLPKMDFTLLTSISEGQPLAVLESFAAGRPVIATDVGCCREIIEGVTDCYGNAGICVSPMNPSAISSAMLKLCRNPELCKTMGKNGRDRVVNLFKHQTMLEKYLNAYDKAVAKWQE